MPKLIDLTGQRFGRLVVLERAENDERNRTMWKCRCDCGGYTIARTSALRSGQKSSCGCLQREKVGNINKGKSKSDDLTGKRFEMLVAKKQVGLSENGGALWECMCDCGNTKIIPATYLKRGISYSCGCKKKLSSRAKDLTGMRVGRLTVIELGEDLILPSGGRVRRWKCKCDCGNETLVIHSRLIHGETKSCGCLARNNGCGRRRFNEYSIEGDIAYITITNTEEKVICDANMVEELKKYCWHISKFGYAVSRQNGKWYRMHRVVLGAKEGEIIDHINQNKLDNRKENLRISDASLNNFNKNGTNGKSGIAGVYRRNRKWRSTITVNSVNIHLGYFESLEEAIEARKKAEIKYYGELKEK